MRHAIRRTNLSVLLTLALIMMAALPVDAQGCPELLGRWPYGPARTVAVSGSIAYVGSGTALLVVDVSTPGSPQLLGDVILPDLVYGIAAVGSHAYVADGESGLRVIDVSVPSAPLEVGFLDTPGAAYGVAVAGSYAYVADGSSGLRVISIANPSSPTEVGFVDTLGTANRVAVVGGHAYVADGDEGLRVISLASPSAPVEVGFIDTPGSAYGVAVSGSLAFVADGSSGLRIVSVADPSLPTEVGFFDTTCSAQDVAVDGGTAIVADGFCHLRLIDVGDPSAPIEVGSLNTGGQVRSVVAAAGLAFVADEYAGMVVVDASNPNAPVVVGSYLTAGYSFEVASAAGFAYVGVAPSTLRVIDVSAPASPTEIGAVAMRENPVGLALSGSYAFAAVLNAGLEVVDIKTPAAPVPIGWLDTPGQARGVTIVGSLAYVADGTSGLRVVDVNEPREPVEVGFVDTPGVAYAVAVGGDYAYVADDSAGLRIIDIGDPSAPTEVGFVDTPGSAFAVALVGDYALVADSHMGVRVVDVSVPSAPQEIGSYDGPYSADDIAVVGELAYVAGRGAGVLVLDVSTPTTPVLVGSYDTPGDTWRVALDNGAVFAADGNAGLVVLGDCETSAFESVIPAAAVAAGAQGAFFQTDVEINNNGSGEAQVTFFWLPRGEDNSEPPASDTFTLAPGESLRFENALAELFGLGPDSFGAIRIVSSTQGVIGMSRTYNIPDGKAAGTFGQGLPAVKPAAMIADVDPQHIIFLSESSDSRANVGCVNATDQTHRIDIDVFDDEGVLLDTRTMDLGPYSNDQINRVLRDWQPVNGAVDVRGDGADALFYCYGSMLDNLTSDATTILPQTPSSRTTFIPAAALAAGLEGAFFQTDLDLRNVGSTDLRYEFLWLPRGADNGTPVRSGQFSLAAGAGVRYANVLQEVFSLEPDQLGALAVEAKEGDLIAMSRTYNLPAGGVAGTFGQAMPGVPSDRMIPNGRKMRIIFMNENAELRANVGCQNGTEQSVRVFVELFNSQGESLEVKTMDLPPLSNNQITRAFRSHAPVSAGYVDVWTNTSGASIYCYGSVLDNETSDPTTVLPQ